MSSMEDKMKHTPEELEADEKQSQKLAEEAFNRLWNADYKKDGYNFRASYPTKEDYVEEWWEERYSLLTAMGDTEDE